MINENKNLSTLICLPNKNSLKKSDEWIELKLWIINNIIALQNYMVINLKEKNMWGALAMERVEEV